MMARPKTSSLQRAVRFNMNQLLDVNSLEDVDLDDAEHDVKNEHVPSSDDDTPPPCNSRNTEYIEFRKLLQVSSSTRKVISKTGSSSHSGATKSTTAAKKATVESRRKSSSLSSKDLKIITDTASTASREPAPSSQRDLTTAEAEPMGERDDEPTIRQEDDYHANNKGRANAQQGNSPISTAQSHFSFAIPDGDEQNIRVVCNIELSSQDGASVPVASTFDLKTAPSMPLPIHSTDVVIAVEASSVSALDCVVRRGFDGRAPVPSGYTPGCDLIGTVVKCGQEVFLSGISEGERVACITRYGGNARYIRVPVDVLIKARDDIDPGEAAGALLPYFVAFQILHSGISAPRRYRASLKGKRILVAENTGLIGLAIASLCKVEGVQKAYIVCPEEHHEQMKSLGSVPLAPLGGNVDTWANILKTKVDVLVIAATVPGKVQRIFLKASGRLVRLALPPVPPQAESKPSLVPAPLRDLCAMTHLSFFASSRASFYDVFYSIERNQALYKSDMTHIFNLLAFRRIRPKVDKFVLLQDVGECHQELEKFQQEGAIVCEPWRRGGIDNMIYKT